MPVAIWKFEPTADTSSFGDAINKVHPNGWLDAWIPRNDIQSVSMRGPKETIDDLKANVRSNAVGTVRDAEKMWEGCPCPLIQSEDES